MNVRTKFEFRSFTRSWDNRDSQKILTVPEYTRAPFTSKFFNAGDQQ